MPWAPTISNRGDAELAGMVLRQPVIQRLQAHAQHFGAPPLVAFAQVERRIDGPPLDFREWRSHLDTQGITRRHRELQARKVKLDLGVGVGENERPLESIFELADVARPAMRADGRDCIPGKHLRRALGVVELAKEVLRE